MSLEGLATWIAATPPSVLIQRHEAWVIPTIQSMHIAGVGVVLACVLMMTLRVLGYAGMDQSVVQVHQRFGPWLSWALALLLATGFLMIVGEPERELINFSFWAKMTLVALGAAVAFGFQHAVRVMGPEWESLVDRGWVKAMAIATLLVWLAIVALGRLIAYDHIWGPLSPAPKA
jgi:hypothetical protein